MGPYTIVSASTDAQKAIQLAGGLLFDIGLVPLCIAANGGIAISGNGDLTVVVYAPNGPVSLSGQTNLLGAVVGATIQWVGATQSPIRRSFKTDVCCPAVTCPES